MNAKRFYWLAVVAIANLLGLAACAPQVTLVEVTRVITETEIVDVEGEAVIIVGQSDVLCKQCR
ncbi:MAG: hypothetical protein GY805_19885 [Chloroflexi bacterium]|nr:hypothetical protein [Chloroflexota bacterium]